MEKSPNGYLGKVRSNFLGTEFCVYDSGKNPKKAKTKDQIRSQQGVVQYETNVLGSKGPRRMKVLLPNVDLQGHQHIWRPTDVSFQLTRFSLQATETMQEQFKVNNTENMMFFFNKPPKWNECKFKFRANFKQRCKHLY